MENRYHALPVTPDDITAANTICRMLAGGILDLIAILEKSFSKMDKEELAGIKILNRPFWPIINGPFSDVLTHIGQISSLRRIAGSPAPDSNPFEASLRLKSKIQGERLASL
jgi:hypothetical protein